MTKRRLCIAAAIAGLSFGLAPAFAAETSAVVAAVQDVGRHPADMARDANRKPLETMSFSGIKPGDVVVDFVPGGGYYTRILSKLVGPKGRVYAVVPLRGGAPGQVRSMEAKAIAAGKPLRPNPVDTILEIENTSEYNNIQVLWQSLTTFGAEFAIPEQVDAVWTSDNYHDLHNPGFVNPDPDLISDGPAPTKGALNIAALNKLIFAALKPGGVFVVADHAAAKGAGFTQTGTLHRADEDAVKAEILAAGFVLDGESKALANAADDHTKKVTDLHDKTDQFLLRFKKPETAGIETKRPSADAMAGYYGNTSQSGMGTPTHRWVFYHSDGTYEEYGISGSLVQQGTWFWDATGHNCMIHQFPAPERQGLVCHATKTNVKPGDNYTQDNGGGPPRPYFLSPGYTQPKVTDIVGRRY